MRLLQPKAALRPNEERLRHPKEKACSSTTKTTNKQKNSSVSGTKGKIVYVTEIITIKPNKGTSSLVQVWSSKDVAERVYNNDIEYNKKHYSNGNAKISEEKTTFPYAGKIHTLKSNEGVFIAKITAQKILR